MCKGPEAGADVDCPARGPGWLEWGEPGESRRRGAIKSQMVMETDLQFCVSGG